MNTQHPPLALKAVIPDIAGAIKIDGGDGDGARLMLDLYPEELEQINALLGLRGKELIVVFQAEDHG